MFFSNLKRKNQKWTFINVHFPKKSFKFEKKMHIIDIGVRPPYFRGGLPLCFGWANAPVRQ
jgi:hypothetical protein